jgi:hypothetical protein
MKISLVTDEISADPETAIELGVDWGVHDFELRGFGADRVPNFSAFEKQRIRELLEEFEARIVAISPGLFKIPYPGAKRERFPLRAFDAALYERWQAAQARSAHRASSFLVSNAALHRLNRRPMKFLRRCTGLPSWPSPPVCSWPSRSKRDSGPIQAGAPLNSSRPSITPP